jgi:hypothetical protein
MRDLIYFLAEIVNNTHDIINQISKQAGWNMTDKDLHLWVFGIVGIIAFGFVHVVFKALAQYSVTAISFIYTFTVILVLVFAIEIQQKITGRGQMDFDDAVVSLWGFLLFFMFFLILKGITLRIIRFLKK